MLPVLAEFNVKEINHLALTLIHDIWPRENVAEKTWYEFFYDHFQFLEAYIFRGKSNRHKTKFD